MNLVERMLSFFTSRAILPEEALKVSFASLDRWLADEESTRNIVFLRLLADSPAFHEEWANEYRADIQEVFSAPLPEEQKIRLRQLTIARCESLVLNQTYLDHDENQRSILLQEVLGQGESLEESDAMSVALVARANCTLMLARQLQDQFFNDVASNDYFSAFSEARRQYVKAIFDVSLSKHEGTDSAIEAFMIAPLQQILDRVKTEALTGSDRRYLPSPR